MSASQAERRGFDPRLPLQSNIYVFPNIFRIFSKSIPALPAERTTAEIAAEGAAAIAAKIRGATRRKRTLDTFRRYCEGQSLRAIAKATGRQKSTISCDLHLVETMIGKRFVRTGPVSTYLLLVADGMNLPDIPALQYSNRR